MQIIEFCQIKVVKRILRIDLLILNLFQNMLMIELIAPECI